MPVVVSPMLRADDRGPSRRIQFNLSQAAYEDLVKLAEQRNTSLAELFRLALGLLKFVSDAELRGHKLFVGPSPERILREISLP